ncbi:SAM-dependent methyltransferase [Catenulispora subtropica]|uniref:SAM-dependent methyltransferase n=1 Tax=Catenulispora subtropica TaxID=450798 RepID=A0ABP5EK10_9ACTN
MADQLHQPSNDPTRAAAGGTTGGKAGAAADGTVADPAADPDPLAPGWVPPPELDTTRAHPARIYEYLLGGMHYFDVDREAAETALRHVPQGRAMVQENRAFLARAVRFLAERGLTQFLDLGSGLPGTGNIGAVARSVLPEARIVFVDYDPMVAVHGRALVAGADPAHTAVVMADVRRPAEVLADPELRRVLDLDRPVAVLMAALLHFIAPEEEPHRIVREFLAAVPSGSALVVTHLTDGGHPDQAEAARQAWDRATSQLYVRSDEEIRALFDGLDVVEPGLVPRPLWRPDGEVRPDWKEIWGLAGIGIKP